MYPSVHPSVCMKQCASTETDLRNFVYGIFTVVCLNIPILIKWNQNNTRHLTWRPSNIFGRRFCSLILRQNFLCEVGDVAEEKVDFPNVTQDSARIKEM
jgi:hypothetical protein